LKEHQNSIIFFRSRKRQNDLFIFAWQSLRCDYE
jgi:hypothetical protein